MARLSDELDTLSESCKQAYTFASFRNYRKKSPTVELAAENHLSLSLPLSPKPNHRSVVTYHRSVVLPPSPSTTPWCVPSLMIGSIVTCRRLAHQIHFCKL
jgi:hypothetical protein